MPRDGTAYAPFRAMKRAAYKLAPDRGGWLRTTLAPINDKDDIRFGGIDIVMFFCFVTATVVVARFFLAN